MKGKQEVMVACAVAAGIVLGAAVVLLLGWQAARQQRCCPLPADHLPWACGHRRTWEYRAGTWRRISRERFIQLSLEGLDTEAEELLRGHGN